MVVGSIWMVEVGEDDFVMGLVKLDGVLTAGRVVASSDCEG